MNTQASTTRRPVEAGTTIDPRVIDHFHASAALYELWSAEGHLHFGYWKWPMSPVHRRAMLNAMVYRVVQELHPQRGQRLADLGCGYGASARTVAGMYDTAVEAFTVVPEQAQRGQQLAELERVDVTMHLRDFRQTALPAASMDGVYALESLCYGGGHGKADVLAEAARILKPGGRIALVDGFIIKPPTGVRASMVRTVERGWAVPCFPRQNAFVQAMERAGFTDIAITDLSWNVAPAAAHGLPLMAWTKLRNLLSGERLAPLEHAHLKSCLYGIALGTQRDLFRYLLITGRKG
jgi:cyclopropane fatty-acyl-phospholipid synthase-like methyltransferase